MTRQYTPEERAYHAKWMRERRDERRAAGLCTDCGTESPRLGGKLCNCCSVDRRVAARLRRGKPAHEIAEPKPLHPVAPNSTLALE